MRINDKGNDTVVKPLASFPLKLLPPSKPMSKHPSKSTTNLFINDLFYSMMLMLQVMMKNKFIRGFQNRISKQQQQSQDPVLRTVYSWFTPNEKPEYLTPLITGTPLIHAYYKRFSQFFYDNSTNLISLYTKHTLSSDTHPQLTSQYGTEWFQNLSSFSNV